MFFQELYLPINQAMFNTLAFAVCFYCKYFWKRILELLPCNIVSIRQAGKCVPKLEALTTPAANTIGTSKVFEVV
jgi:hypothetical protein